MYILEKYIFGFACEVALFMANCVGLVGLKNVYSFLVKIVKFDNSHRKDKKCQRKALH